MAAVLGENGRPTVIPLPDTTTEKPILEQAPTLCTVYALQLNLLTSSLYSRISGISPQKPFDVGHPYSTVNLECRVLSFSVERWIYVVASSWMQMIIDAEDQILWHSEALWLAVPDTVHVLEDLLNCTYGVAQAGTQASGKRNRAGSHLMLSSLLFSIILPLKPNKLELEPASSPSPWPSRPRLSGALLCSSADLKSPHHVQSSAPSTHKFRSGDCEASSVQWMGIQIKQGKHNLKCTPLKSRAPLCIHFTMQSLISRCKAPASPHLTCTTSLPNAARVH